MSLWRHPNRPINGKLMDYELIFELVKVIGHQCVIFGRYNATTEFVRLRLRSKGNIKTVWSALRGISWETSMIFAASRLRSWRTTELNGQLVWSSRASPSTQTTVTNKSTTSRQHHSNAEQNSGNWTECAHRPTNGHRHHYYLSNEQLTINRRNWI